MTIEVACSNCNGRLLVSTPGQVVACPHCGTHLSIPAAETPMFPSAPAPVTEPPTPIVEDPPMFPGPPVVEQTPAATAEAPMFPSAPAPATEQSAPIAEDPPMFPGPPVIEQPALPLSGTELSLPAPGIPNASEEFHVESALQPVAATPEATVAPGIVPEVPVISPVVAPEASPQLDQPGLEARQPLYEEAGKSLYETPPPQVVTPMVTPAQPEPQPVAPQFPEFPEVHPPVQAEVPVLNTATPVSPATAATVAQPVAQVTSVEAAGGELPAMTSMETTPRSARVPKIWFMLALSYASAMTIGFIYLYMAASNQKPHALESLPDIEPRMKNKKIAVSLYPEDANVAPGHELKFGQEERFGNIVVKPIKVTRGPLNFVHYTGNAKKKHPSSKPVLKLWLKLKNASDDQVVFPVTKKLVLFRSEDKKNPGNWRANNFLCPLDEKSRTGKRVLMYDMPEHGNWDLKGQNLGRELQPGESMTTFLATTEEGLKGLKGNLVWRVHFRKGYNPKSLRGVTTLIEVDFSSKDIINERG